MHIPVAFMALASVAGLAGVIVSTAIEKDNGDLLRAQELGIPVIHRATALAQVVAGRRLIAVAGTCGKSTVTAMAGWMLARASPAPTVCSMPATPRTRCSGCAGRAWRCTRRTAVA